MSFTKEDILAGTFFDIADKIQQISDSDIAKEVDTFGDDDYVSLIASVLDAAHWILAGQLGDDTEEDATALYVNMKVYTDLLYRGFDPQVAWEESGLDVQFGEPEENDATLTKEASGGTGNGDYVLFEVAPGQMRAGRVLNYPHVLCFDGVISKVPDVQVRKLSRKEAGDFLAKWGSDIMKTVRRRVDAREPL